MATRRFHWDPVDDCVLHETAGDGATLVTYTHEPGAFGPLLSENRGGTEFQHHYDVLGSTTLLTDDAGAVTDTFQYDAWGNIVARTGMTPTPYTWVGRWGYQDDSATTGGYYIRARSYQPTVARWKSVDPLLVYDPFIYVRNKPSFMIDPSGQIAIPNTVPGKCNNAIALSQASDLGWTLCMCFLVGKGDGKCADLEKYGQTAATVIKQPPQPDVKISTNPNAFFCGLPGTNQYFGPDGMQPSVGFIVQIPDANGSIKTILHAHLSGKTWAEDLKKYDFPKGSHGVICGGDNTKGSNCTLINAFNFFVSKGITVDGIVDWDGCFVGADLKYYVRQANKRSINDPKC